MSLLEVSDVVAGYGQYDSILKGASIAVDAGEMVALLGPNGAGKSTLLKSIAGAIRPREGSIVVDGENIVGQRPREITRHGVGYVPQEANIFPSLSVVENLEIGGYLDRALIRQRMEQVWATMPDLLKHRSSAGRALSGGQRQMLAVGMALMAAPKLLLLDEPSAGLSPAAAEKLFALLVSICKGGVAIALVEQNALSALEVADRAYILVDGKVSTSGSASSLLADQTIRQVFLGG